MQLCVCLHVGKRGRKQAFRSIGVLSHGRLLVNYVLSARREADGSADHRHTQGITWSRWLGVCHGVSAETGNRVAFPGASEPVDARVYGSFRGLTCAAF